MWHLFKRDRAKPLGYNRYNEYLAIICNFGTAFVGHEQSYRRRNAEEFR